MPRILYIPVGRTNFDLVSAKRIFAETLATLNELGLAFDAPPEILTSVETLGQFLGARNGAEVDLVIFQTTTFVGANFVTAVSDWFAGPIVVWSVREPEVGLRLRLNSLTGGNSACHALRYRERVFDFWFGNPSELRVRQQILSKWRALCVFRQLTGGMKVGVVGEPPLGFAFCSAHAGALRAAIGVNLVKLDLSAIFKEAAGVPEKEWGSVLQQTAGQVRDLPRTSETTIKFAKVAALLAQYSAKENISAMAIRCWPEFFSEFGAAACSTLSFLTEAGIVSSCEADIHGVVSMFILRAVSDGLAPYLGDLVHLEESNNSVVFWHCGAGAFSLARSSTGARASGHPNNHVGLTLDFGLKPGRVTICRLSRVKTKYRMLIMEGEALDSPQKFHGTTVEVRIPGDALTTMTDLMSEGFEPHYAIVHADVVAELTDLCKLLCLEHTIYSTAGHPGTGIEAVKKMVPALLYEGGQPREKPPISASGAIPALSPSLSETMNRS